jgi:hypothetical protein
MPAPTKGFAMTRHEPNQIDQKKGSADERTSDQREGAFGKHIAAGENLPPPSETNAAPDADASDADATRADQSGCGPTVTDYPGLGKRH